MQKYVKVYLEARWFDKTDFIPCEVCGKQGVDIHHIEGRKWSLYDDIETLIALCREHHELFEANNTLEVRAKLKQLVKFNLDKLK